VTAARREQATHNHQRQEHSMPATATSTAAQTDPGAVTRTEPVTPACWPETCAAFSREHHGWLVRVLTLPTAAAERGDLAGATEVAAGLPLLEVAMVAADPRPNMDVRVRDDGERTVQRVEEPRSMALERGADGSVRGLRVDDTEGMTTLVRFRSVVPQEMLDGLAAGER
jgi:hypothetical protein